MKNSLGRELPDFIPGYGKVQPFSGAFSTLPGTSGAVRPPRHALPGSDKLVGSLRGAIERSGLKNGMTVSFHHHLREGDRVLNLVMDEISAMGIRDIRIAPTALFGVHREIIRHIDSGVVTSINGSLNGPVGRKVSSGVFSTPVVLRSHGGRARAIEAGDLKIDVAFIAAPSADEYGNISGSFGPSACGPLGYAVPDAMYAGHVVAVTDNLVPYPMLPASIEQIFVDTIVAVDSIGDPRGIVSGTTKVTTDPLRLKQARLAADILYSAGFIRPDFSFQTGAGGASLAVASFVADIMREKLIIGSFGCGGITGMLVNMLNEGLFRKLLDVQSFDLAAVRSIGTNPDHVEMSASMYANPHNSGCVVNRLDAVILGATEVDVDFNVNVNTEFDGALVHGIGGHMDTAAGAATTVVVAPLIRGRVPLVVDRVFTVTSPGETIDVVVTDRGVAVNPRRPDLAIAAAKAGIKICDIAQLRDRAYDICGKPEPLNELDEIVGVIEYRDGTVIDVVRKVETAGH